MPGGVNSPVRAFNGVGGTPVYMRAGAGARMTTAEGASLLDFCGSWGPLILGHARREVVAAIRRAAGAGTSFGANTEAEVEFAELLCELAPDLDKVRLTSSGTEATMTALRLARGATGRRRILKFDGGYHGHVDALLVSAGSGLLTGGVTSSAGVPESQAADVWVAPYNDLAAVRKITAEFGGELAAIIVEPVAANMGLVAPLPGFLEGLRDAASRCGALLIFDEVITGFRFGPTTYGRIRGIVPDLTCLGKIIGGGMPVGTVGGKAGIMDLLAPLGPVYQAGTLSGNPVAVAAGLTTLKLLRAENPYSAMERLGHRLAAGLNAGALRPAREPVYAVLRAGADDVAGRSQDVRHERLRSLLPRNVETGNLSAAVPVRGRIRFGGAHRRRRGCVPGRGRTRRGAALFPLSRHRAPRPMAAEGKRGPDVFALLVTGVLLLERMSSDSGLRVRNHSFQERIAR